MKSIGENIAALRKKNNMTQEALAAEIGVSAQAVSKWENGTNLPDIQLLPVLADVFGVSIDALYGREKGKSELKIPEIFEECCEAVMNTIGTAFYNSMRYDLQSGVNVPARDLEEYLHDVAALGVSHDAHAVGIFHFAHIAGVAEMIQNLFGIHKVSLLLYLAVYRSFVFSCISRGKAGT